MNQINKQLTSFWNLIKRYKIVIPIIQRDYAQGRDEESPLRKRFLSMLKQTLDLAIIASEPNSKTTQPHQLILDFVYGTPAENGAIAPLDGQQRLTTLWLLHWFVAYMTGNLSDDVRNALKSFSYETRVSSRDFCEKLCDLVHIDNSKSIDGTLIKRHIENQTWFYSEWKQDPTVYGMLTMLFGNNQNDSSDNIFDIFGHDKETLTKYWKLLTSNNIEQSPIMFNHTIIGSEELPLSDDLYIKMNARGKPLTNFENFKAEVIKWVSENVSKEESIRVASKFDNEWTDIFWENGLGKSVHNVDELFFAFFNRIYYQYVVTERNSEEFVLSEKNSDKNSEYRLFSGSKNKHEKNSGDKFVTFQSLEPYTSRLKKVLTSLETIFQGIRQIDLSTLQPYWKKDFYFIPRYILDKDIPKQLTDEILDFTTINQQERVAFYAICKYFLSPSHDDDEKESLSHWMRFVWNLISDKDSGGADTIRSVSAIQQAVALIDMIENPRRVYGELYEKSSEYRQKLKNNTVLEHRFIEEIEKSHSDSSSGLQRYTSLMGKGLGAGNN